MRLDNMNRFRSVAMAMAIISSGTLCAQTEQPDILSESVDGSRGHFVYAALGYGNITSRIEGNWDSGMRIPDLTGSWDIPGPRGME